MASEATQFGSPDVSYSFGLSIDSIAEPRHAVQLASAGSPRFTAVIRSRWMPCAANCFSAAQTPGWPIAAPSRMCRTFRAEIKDWTVPGLPYRPTPLTRCTLIPAESTNASEDVASPGAFTAETGAIEGTATAAAKGDA